MIVPARKRSENHDHQPFAKITAACRQGQARLGAYVLQGATHQFGDEDRGIPARPFLGLSDDDRVRIEDLVVGDLAKLLE